MGGIPGMPPMMNMMATLGAQGLTGVPPPGMQNTGLLGEMPPHLQEFGQHLQQPPMSLVSHPADEDERNARHSEIGLPPMMKAEERKEGIRGKYVEPKF